MIRWGVIGCGAVTEVKSLPAFQKVDEFEIKAITSRNFQKAKNFASRHQINMVYKNADELINDPSIDAIYIATPPDSHHLYALKVADAKKICCIEKPMAVNFKQAYEINEAFKKINTPLFISYYRRSLPRFLKIKEWIVKKKIGTIRHISWQLHKPPNSSDLNKTYNWRVDKNIAYGGYFDDVGSHGLNLFSFLLGDIIHAKGVCTNQQNLYSAKDSITASWMHPNNITGSGSWNFGAFKRVDRVNIFGSDGEITFSVLDEHPIEYENHKKKESLTIPNPQNIQLYHAKNIKKHLNNISIHPSLGESGVHTNWVMDKILGITNV
jgi:predicted dehydrogenase